MLGDIVKHYRDGQQRTQVDRRLYEAISRDWIDSRTISYDGSNMPEDVQNLEEKYYFRVSDFYRLCPRLVALARRKPIVEVYDHEDLWRFAEGHANHDAMQKALPFIQNGKVYRSWWKHPVHGIKKGDNGSAIARPDGEGWQCHEMTLKDPKLYCIGHVDGALDWPDLAELWEHKTIDAMLEGRINPAKGGKPLPWHIVQCQGYMMLSDYTQTRITYKVKGSGGLAVNFYEHVVLRDEEMIAGMKDLLRDCKAAFDVHPKGRLPDRIPACTTASCTRAQRCPGRKRCFTAL